MRSSSPGPVAAFLPRSALPWVTLALLSPSMIGSAIAAAASPPAPPVNDAERYCHNLAAAAADARFEIQTRKLTDLEGEIASRVAALEGKEAELKDLLARRDEALKQARETLVAIYAKMRPDAAAQQISALDDSVAAAVLSSLNARQASAILNEITPERAVKLVNAISSLLPPDEKKS